MVTASWVGACLTSSAHSSVSEDSTPRSPPRRSASSAAIIQSVRAVPAGVTLRCTTLTRPSRLVVVPSHSANPATGSTTSACNVDAVGNRSSEMTVRAPATRTPGEGAIRDVDERVGAEQDQHVDATLGGRADDAVGVEAALGRDGAPDVGPDRTTRLEGGAPGQHPRSEARLERTADVAAAQPDQEPGAGHRVVHRERRVDRRTGGLGEVRPSDHDAQLVAGVGDEAVRGADRLGVHPGDARVVHVTREHRGDERCDLAGAVLQRRRRVRREAGGGGADLDDAGAVGGRGVAEPQVQHRQLLLRVGPEVEHGRAGSADLVDGGAGQAERDLGGESVAELRVDVVGADDPLGELRPGVLRLVGEPTPAEHGDGAGVGLADRCRGTAERVGPPGG